MDRDPFEKYFKLYSWERNTRKELKTFGGRYSTYKTFPLDSAFPTRLAECGLYHIGINDEVKCIGCKFSFRGWKPEDVPFEVHFRDCPNCPFLLQNKFHIRLRKNFTSSEIRHIITTIFRPSGVSEGFAASGSSCFSQPDPSSGAANMTDTQAVVPEIAQSVEENGTAILDQATIPPAMQQTKKEDEPGGDALSPVNNRNPSNVPRHRSVRQKLAKNTKCNNCWKVDSTIVFMPCSHLISCQECAARLECCFLCGEVILEKIEIKRG